MLFLAPTPSPIPTVTVTQTVPVFTTAPAPTITLVPPPEGIDFWKDIIWGDFGGAALGAIVSIAVAYWLTSRERDARLDERRRNLATQLSGELEGFLAATLMEDRMTKDNRTEARNRLRKALELISILKTEEHKDPHKVFRKWLSIYERRLLESWVSDDGIQRVSAIATRMLAGVQVWHSNPRPWQKAESAEKYDPSLADDASARPSSDQSTES